MQDLVEWFGDVSTFSPEFVVKYIIFVTALAAVTRLIGEIINNTK